MNIVSWPDVNKQPCVPVVHGTSLKWATDQMTDFVLQNRGLGLAAPQVGIYERYFVLCIDRPMVFINPVYLRLEKPKYKAIEACYSIPGKYYKVSRYAVVVLMWYDLDWRLQEARFNGLVAQAIQHEMAHLDGICIADAGKMVAEKKERT